jgi:serine/threonine protein kinase
MPLAGQPISPVVANLPVDSMQETVLAAELAAHSGYQFVRQLLDQTIFGSSRALQMRCSRTNRLRTLLQVPRSELQHLDHTQQQQLVQEVQLASSMHHPHMLQVQEVFVGPLHLNIVLEECSAGRLLDYPAKQQAAGMCAAAGVAATSAAPAAARAEAAAPEAAPEAALSPEFARWFFQQVVLAVHYCHAKGVTGLAIEHTMLKVSQA